MPTTRKSLSKRLRFAVFARDQFTCRYCGQSPPVVKLVVDHLIPVVEGGTSEETNLITACEPCNQGKAGKPLAEHAPTDADSKRLAQEYLEQIELAELASRAADARMALRKAVVDYFCSMASCDSMKRANVTRLCNLIQEFGPEAVYSWIDSATSKIDDESNVLKYINGIARNCRETAGDDV